MTELEQAQTKVGRQIDERRDDAANLVEGEPRFFNLDDQPCTLGRWTELFEERQNPAGRWRVNETYINDVRVSTVWMGLDANYFAGPPLIYETMVFGGEDVELEGETWRYSTRAQAEAGHNAALRMVAERLALRRELGDNHDE